MFGALAWLAGWAAMVALDGHLDLSNLALVLVLSAAVAALWLVPWMSFAASALSVAAFNWAFVPPRGTFHVDVHQHALLLVAMLAVSWIVSGLVTALRRQARMLQRTTEQVEQLRQWGETLRDAADPLAHVGTLREALQALGGHPCVVWALKDRLPAANDDTACLHAGDADAEQSAGLWHCIRQGQAMGPGTGRHQDMDAWYLPLRGRGVTLGAALLAQIEPNDAGLRAHAQDLCDQLGTALQRAQTLRDERHARDAAQAQSVRNALLAAVSHDYRTPLATIAGAASSMVEQTSRLDAAQRERLARTVLEETARLSRLTDNTLQLARLDAPQVHLRCDWESAEELVGSVMRRARARSPQRKLHARLEPDLPLLWCDAMLLTQLLDNLLDNALKYTPESSPIEVLVRREADQVVLAVRDRGPGVEAAWRERIFDAYQRGAPSNGIDAASASSHPGAGVGLAVCRAIARVHGGEMRVRARGHGGSSFECRLPIHPMPPRPEQEASP
jgi:two-component system sensor histidine kinase KdpD